MASPKNPARQLETGRGIFAGELSKGFSDALRCAGASLCQTDRAEILLALQVWLTTLDSNYAALRKPSICRSQLVTWFEPVKTWATSLRS
jgi:hypothetical protein